jgi:hypothetical protein
MACRSIRPVKSWYAYPNTSAYARICSCESRALRPGMNSRWMAIKRPALSSPGGHVQQGEGDRDVVRRRGAPCLTTDSRRVTGNRNPARGARSGRPGTRREVRYSDSPRTGQPRCFLSAEGMCAGPQRKMESPAQRCSPLRDEAVLLQPGQLLAGGRRASRGRWQACSSRRRCGRPDVQVRGGGVVAAAEAVPTVTQPEHNITGRRRRPCHTVGDRSSRPLDQQPSRSLATSSRSGRSAAMRRWRCQGLRRDWGRQGPRRKRAAPQ